MSDVKCPSTFQRVGGGKDPAVPVHATPVGQPRPVSGEQHEDLGRVGQGVIVNRYDREDIARDMIHEDPPQGESTEKSTRRSRLRRSKFTPPSLLSCALRSLPHSRP